jgi:hypothetical protein
MKYIKWLKWIVPVWGMIEANENWLHKKEMSWKTFGWWVLSMIEMLWTFAAVIALSVYTSYKTFVTKEWKFETVITVTGIGVLVSFVLCIVFLIKGIIDKSKNKPK